MIKKIFIILFIFLFFSCATTTRINTLPSGVKVYKDVYNEQYLGKTPLKYRDSKIGGAVTYFILKKDGFKDKRVYIKKNEPNSVNIILSFIFQFYPALFWWGKYEPIYNFELEKNKELR